MVEGDNGAKELFLTEEEVDFITQNMPVNQMFAMSMLRQARKEGKTFEEILESKRVEPEVAGHYAPYKQAYEFLKEHFQEEQND